MKVFTLNDASLSSWTTLFLLSCEAYAGRELTGEEVGMLVDAALEYLVEDDLETCIAEEAARNVLDAE